MALSATPPPGRARAMTRLVGVYDAEGSVVAGTDEGEGILLDRAALESCGGEPSALLGAVRRGAEERGLALHEPT